MGEKRSGRSERESKRKDRGAKVEVRSRVKSDEG